MCNEFEKSTRVFNGTYTIQNRSSSDYRTFRIRTQPDNARFKPGERIIAMRIGPDNSFRSWLQFGTITDEGISVWFKQRERMTKFARAFWAIVAEEKFGDQYEVMASTTCLRCNRELTTPESIRCGIGPVCAERVTEMVNGKTVTVAEAERIRRIARRYKELKQQISSIVGE